MNMTMAKALPVPDSCVKDPKQGNCSSFDYPHANAANDLSRLCSAMNFMAGECLAVGTVPRWLPPNDSHAAAAPELAHAPHTYTRAQGPLCIILTACTHKSPGLPPRRACEQHAHTQAAACRKPATRQVRACQDPRLALVLLRSPATTQTPARSSTTWQPSADWTLACHAWQVGHTHTCVCAACLPASSRMVCRYPPARAGTGLQRQWHLGPPSPLRCAVVVLSADCRRCTLCVVAVCVSWACRL